MASLIDVEVVMIAEGTLAPLCLPVPLMDVEVVRFAEGTQAPLCLPVAWYLSWM